MSDKKQAISDKMSDKRLLPCPFCGGEAILDREDIFCDNCHLSMTIHTRVQNGEAETYEEARAQAIEQWNTRKPVEAVLDRMEEEYVEVNTDDDMWWNRAIDKAVKIIKERLA